MTDTGHARYIQALLLAWKDFSQETTVMPAYRELGSMLAEIEMNPKDISTSVISYSFAGGLVEGLQVCEIAGLQRKTYSFELNDEELERIRETDEYKRAREVIRARNT